MNPAVLALFTRSLSLDSRRFRTYGIRIALVMTIGVIVMFAHASSTGTGAPGLTFFTGINWSVLILLSVAGIQLFSSVITEEKEEMMLGLLMMTGLRPISIMLGKSASRVAEVLLLLAAQFPFTLLAVTLGGVSLDQLIASYFAVVAYVILLGGVGILCSVLCRKSESATALAMLLLAGLIFVPLLGGFILSELVQGGVLSGTGFWTISLTTLFDWMRAASPFGRMNEIMTTGFAGHPLSFQVLADVGIGVGCFLLAWLLFDLFTREQKTVEPTRGLLARRNSTFRPLRVGRAWSHALAWKEFYFGAQGVGLLILKAVAIAGMVAAYALIRWGTKGRPITTAEMGAAVLILAIVLAGLELLSHASRSLSREWQQETLSSLLLLPMSTGELFRQKVVGCLVAMTPYALFAAVGAVLSPRAVVEVLLSPVFWIAGPLTLLHLVFLLYLVAVMSLVFKRSGAGVGLLIWLAGILVAGVFVVVASVLLIIPMHIMLMQRIEKAAGE